MTQNVLKIGYSSCPNDTFIMGALANGLVKCPFKAEITLEDVETLNQWSIRGLLDVTKLSFCALGHVLDTYALLPSGAALGRGCGPVIVARKGTDIKDLSSSKVATPGTYTTARLLLQLFSGKDLNTVEMIFSEIMPAVARGDVEFGLVIHEGRFTYKQYGLEILLDLGQWWEDQTGHPIPLGGIAIKRELGTRPAREVGLAIRKSLLFAQENTDKIMPYILSHAQEMSLDVVNKHIALYVNEFSLELGDRGKSAVEALFAKASNIGIMDRPEKPIFAY